MPAPNEPEIAPRFYVDMSYGELHALRMQRRRAFRDAGSPLITRLLAIDEIGRKRALHDPEVESSAAKKRSPLALLQSAFLADKEHVVQDGYERKLDGGAWHPCGWGGRGGCRHLGLDGGPAWRAPRHGALAGG